ncbi:MULTISPECIES: DUF488 domain-containing protein [unclassified Bradyrhizobium]|uniref:DUF488 domain-containing protein n=1 Tax=unclassified Bradyrhizobium TaxID=2631580 RepID=UPI0028E9267C|nr:MULTISPECIES: DUF488 domain-containing protein [unclassified Bradyrhizobium]
MSEQSLEILTIGHSTLSYESFVALLRQASITAVADVRTVPYSRHFAHFNKDTLCGELRMDGIAYVFLGGQLGGRPTDKRFFCDGIADYEKMAATAEFAQGLARIVEGSRKYRIAMMCSEHDPLDCHRCLLVGRALHEKGMNVRHILGSGLIADHEKIEAQLIEMSQLGGADLFDVPEKRLAAAYRNRARKVAFTEHQRHDERKAMRSRSVGTG